MKSDIKKQDESGLRETESIINKGEIFNVENEHRRLTEEDYGADFDADPNSPQDPSLSDRTSLKSAQIVKIRSVSRLSSAARFTPGGGVAVNANGHVNGNGNYRYNPAESPAASMFSMQLKESNSVPNHPAKYKAKHEEGQESDYRAITMEPLAEVDGMEI